MMASTPLLNSIDSEAPLLMLRNIEKFYGRVQALNFAQLELHKGGRVAVIGANASGKSTLLRLLAGITRQTHGTVTRSDYMSRLRIVYIPQSGGINPDLTVAENLLSMTKLYECAWHSSVTDNRFVKLFELEAFLDIPVRNLSGGYQKLASIAIALSLEPQALFLDEPLSGIDNKHSAQVLDVIDKLAGEIDLLVTTDHSSDSILRCNQHITLQSGQIQ
ncbi:MAG: ATP-binding cassette domain-containing protein [gamma proteobacterium symbiont of Bathyaustriella thionipta]|nr:ATP-binding cassette domain-containing protein [gamma proteobacterium symbiont of Bathyaustriella thionipta]MCU7951084.1 ATP-binding cassette domain-containing protein [gamma proteobacterium symbiont of Bathyaustriella thionipta]MCU7957584.1 ATP-binding cassette domain-containing protein [gamma proteobacterium symbiont of Bathyaustriella thionipta]MCU7966081.1 ATP-binding cassette domain-containing protein [gamma proteobacterium symbiont of Bathyaustriella thionipta]